MKEYSLATKDLMRIYNRTRMTIYNWIAAGLPHKTIKDGKRLVHRFDGAEVEKWLQGR